MSKFLPLQNALKDKGWSISSVELASDCWWAWEIWALRSEWSPVGKIIYLVFLVDPQSTRDPNNFAETDVWAIGLSDAIPNSSPLDEIKEVSVRKNFQKKMSKIVELASDMRMAVLGQKQTVEGQSRRSTCR